MPLHQIRSNGNNQNRGRGATARLAQATTVSSRMRMRASTTAAASTTDTSNNKKSEQVQKKPQTKPANEKVNLFWEVQRCLKEQRRRQCSPAASSPKAVQQPVGDGSGNGSSGGCAIHTSCDTLPVLTLRNDPNQGRSAATPLMDRETIRQYVAEMPSSAIFHVRGVSVRVGLFNPLPRKSHGFRWHSFPCQNTCDVCHVSDVAAGYAALKEDTTSKRTPDHATNFYANKCGVEICAACSVYSFFRCDWDMQRLLVCSQPTDVLLPSLSSAFGSDATTAFKYHVLQFPVVVNPHLPGAGIKIHSAASCGVKSRSLVLTVGVAPYGCPPQILCLTRKSKEDLLLRQKIIRELIKGTTRTTGEENEERGEDEEAPPPALTTSSSSSDDSHPVSPHVFTFLTLASTAVPTRVSFAGSNRAHTDTTGSCWDKHRCAVCLDDMDFALGNCAQTRCDHFFHKSCIETVARNGDNHYWNPMIGGKCPLCRAKHPLLPPNGSTNSSTAARATYLSDSDEQSVSQALNSNIFRIEIDLSSCGDKWEDGGLEIYVASSVTPLPPSDDGTATAAAAAAAALTAADGVVQASTDVGAITKVRFQKKENQAHAKCCTIQ